VASLRSFAIIVWRVWQLTGASLPSIHHTGLSFITKSDWNEETDSYHALSFIQGTLYSSLIADGYNISYVGDQDTNTGGGLPVNEENHEGIGGDTSVDLRTQIDTSGIVQSSLPNVILLLVGTNDIGYGASIAQTDTNIAALLDDIIGKDLDLGARLAAEPVPRRLTLRRNSRASCLYSASADSSSFHAEPPFYSSTRSIPPLFAFET